MKRTIIFLLAAITFCAACDSNKLDDELFVKQVLINQNGFREYDLSYLNAAVRDTIITVAVNGSSTLDRDIKVGLAINPDTLEGYNWEKYRNDRSLYYELLPEDCYSFDGDNVVIKAGTEYADLPIRFNLDKINKEKSYILPISIVSTSEYSIAKPNYSTVLMHIVLSNAYSGIYSLSGTIKEVASGDFIDVRMSRTLRIVDPTTISLYAGNTSERIANREKYRINMTVNADSTLSFTALNPSIIELKSDTPNLDVKNPRNKISVERTIDAHNSHKSYVITTFYMYYNYIDKSDPADPIEIRWEGSCSRTKILFSK